MAFIVGAVLAVAVGLMARVVGLDRDRAFYPTATIVIGFLYVLFAAMGASSTVLMLEAAVGTLFLAAAIAGFRSSLWIVAFALAAHGIFDFVHDRIIPNPGVPAWWPAFCGTYDVMAAAFLAWLLTSDRVRATA